MTTPEPDLAHLPDQWMDERGVTLTRAGVQRVRRRLAEADQEKTFGGA
ncbi:MAG TPA: hypothetical protein VFM54_21230 [Micromonosporaceae bacterium]|nr:hypothetical protein [Micromonosporaceae bacterium]